MQTEISPRDLSLLKEKFTGEELEKAILRVKKGEPLGYVLGEWYFCNETYKVNKNVLIPRPETEHIVEAVIKYCPQNGKIADLCTGSGCIAISSLCFRRDITAEAYDISKEALEVAKQNAKLNGVDNRVSFEALDILTGEPNGLYDIIVSNPPYIQTEVVDNLDPSVKDYEPRLALDGGVDGLTFYRRIDGLSHLVKKGGYIIFEIGYDEGQALREMGYTVTKDYSGNDRLAIKRI